MKDELHSKSLLSKYMVGTEIFEKACRPFGVRYEPLKSFCAGLASVFPGTSRVESAFSTLDQDKRVLSNFGKRTVTGAIHEKQLDELPKVSAEWFLKTKTKIQTVTFICKAQYLV